MVPLKPLLITFLLLQSIAFAYVDSDFDGVEDRFDQCKNTPFSDLVDKRGCSIKRLPLAKEVGTLTLQIGTTYSYYRSDAGNKTKTLSESLEIDYDIQKIKLQLYMAHFNAVNAPYGAYNEAAFADTRMSLGYELDPILPNLQIILSAGVILPTYQGVMHNNRTDFFGAVNGTYFIGKTSLFAGFTYTYIGDHDQDTLTYQNTKALTLGAGYSFTPALYSSLSWYWSDPIVSSAPKIENLTWFMFYNIDRRLYTTWTLAHDLDDDAVSNSYTVQLGYRL